MNIEKKHCFVIMPFSKTDDERSEEYWTAHYEKFLKPIIESVKNINVERSNPNRGDIVNEIIVKLFSADIVVADLTGANPNVYWELGVRQSLKYGTITIAEFGTKLPFDISGKMTLFYHPKDHIKNSHFQNKLLSGIKDCIENPERPDSRVLESLFGKGSLYEVINSEENYRKIIGLYEEIISNKSNYNAIRNRAIKNYKTGNRLYSTGYFRLISIEHFLSNRYLNLDKKSYIIAEKYYNHLNSINGRISMWPYRAAQVEKWLINTMEYEKKMKPFLEEIEKIINERKGI